MERIAEGFVRRRRELIRKGQVGRGRQYPEAMVGEAVRFSELARSAGWSRRQIAQRLELPLATLARWQERSQPAEEVALHEVVVTAGSTQQAVERETLSVVTPDGFRIEGVEVGLVGWLIESLRR